MNLDKTFTLPIQPQFLADPMSGTHLSSGLFLSVESRELRERTSAGCESHLAQPPGVSSSLSGRVLYADGWAKKYNVAVHCSQCTQRTPTAILTAVPSPLHCHVLLSCTTHTTGNLVYTAVVPVRRQWLCAASSSAASSMRLVRENHASSCDPTLEVSAQEFLQYRGVQPNVPLAGGPQSGDAWASPSDVLGCVGGGLHVRAESVRTFG